MPRKKKITYCDTHPDVVSSGVCFDCERTICYNCTIKLMGREFCSSNCASLFMGKNILKGVILLIGQLLRLITYPFRALLKSSPKAAVSIILSCGLAICLFFIYRLQSELTALKTDQGSTAIRAGFPDDAGVTSPQILKPAGGTVTSNTITIEGEAEDNRIISLMINHQLKSVLMPQDGKFSFKNIKLGRGENQLEVRAIHPEHGMSSLHTIVLTYALPAPGNLIADFSRGSIKRKEVALTFDGGANNNAAAEILDVLKEKKVHSTFFLTGQFIRQFPEIVKRIADEGHEAGNHTWSHPHLTSYADNRKHETLKGISFKQLENEFKKTADLYKKTTGKKMAKLWRAPFGEYNPQILQWAARSGYRHVGWTIGRGWDNNMDTLDWVADTTSTIYHSAEEIAVKVINFGKERKSGANGAVILMHLGTNRKKDFPHQKLDAIIEGLNKREIKLVTVSEMMR